MLGLFREQRKGGSSEKSSLIGVVRMKEDLRVGKWRSSKLFLKGDGEARLELGGEVE